METIQTAAELVTEQRATFPTVSRFLAHSNLIKGSTRTMGANIVKVIEVAHGVPQPVEMLTQVYKVSAVNKSIRTDEKIAAILASPA